MSKVSVIIPARNELYIRETIKEVFDNAEDEVEVILVLDGYEPDYKIPRKKGLRTIKNETVIGMRPCVNQGAEAATGKYIMKLDAHCKLGPGWDKILKDDCDDNWITVPRRYWLDAPTWTIKDKQHVDFMTYIYPFTRPYFPRLTCRPDYQRAERMKDELISEDMGFQGSCWFMHKEHFWKRLGGMNTHGYGTFGEEPQEIGLKTQLGPSEGKIMRNKKTWYAHWSKPGSHWRTDPDIAGRVSDIEREAGYLYAWDFWWHNKLEDRKHDFEWIVDRFWPLRTWPDNWRTLVKQYDRYDLKDLWNRARKAPANL